MTFTDDGLLMALCTLMGPILAVAATRYVDYTRQVNDRRAAVFADLMTTRAARLSLQHVHAINRVEIEFANNRTVSQALKAYMTLLEEPAPDTQPLIDLQIKRRQRAFAELVQSIGSALGRRIDKLDLSEGGYYPHGLEQLEELQRDNATRINEVLNQRRPFPVMFVSPPPPGTNSPRAPLPPASPVQAGGPFPPPPT